MVQRCTQAPTFWSHLNTHSIRSSELFQTWCHWRNRYKLYFFRVLVVHLQSTFPNHRQRIRNPFSLHFAFQKGGIDVSSLPSHWATQGHRPAAKYSTVVGFDLQATGPLRCSQSFFGALFAFRYFTKKGFVFGWPSTFFAADLGSFFFLFFPFNRQHGSGIRKVVTNIK